VADGRPATVAMAPPPWPGVTSLLAHRPSAPAGRHSLESPLTALTSLLGTQDASDASGAEDIREYRSCLLCRTTNLSQQPESASPCSELSKPAGFSSSQHGGQLNIAVFWRGLTSAVTSPQTP